MENVDSSVTRAHQAKIPKGTQNTSAKSEEIFSLLVEAVDEYAIFALDPQGRIMTWNLGAQRLKGYSADEIIGSHFSRFYTPEDLARNHPAHELKLAAQNGKYQEEGWRIKKDGGRFWAHVVITALFDDAGTLRGFAKVTRDLTSRRQVEEALRQSEARYRLLIDNISDYSVLFLDPKGRITNWNSGAKKITGYDAKEILGSHVSRFYTPEDVAANKIDTELRIATESGRYEEEGYRVRKNGDKYWANVIITSVKDENGDIIGFSKVTRDLTERKKAEDTLRLAYADLERRIEQRTKEYADAKIKAEAAVKTRDEFFSMASHELKTPLASLKMQAQIRKRNISRGNFKDFAPEKLAELCASDERQVERLSFLVDNMLDVSKLTSGTFQLMPETFQLRELIEDVVARMEPLLQISQNTCRVIVPQDAQVHWDRHRIEQVLTNFLSNAGKYAPGKPIEISATVSDEKAIIAVKDFGRGISAEDQRRIFDPFERVQDRGETAGLGLGLYITSQIVEAHGGAIHLISQLGQGSTFTVELPLNTDKGTL